MKHIRLDALDFLVKEKNNIIKIKQEDEFLMQFTNKDADIRIEIIEDGEVVEGMSTRNLIKGLIVCSNHYLPDTAELEDMREIKTKLEKAVRKGANVTIKNFGKDKIQLILNVKGEDKYHFYLDTIAEVIDLVEETNKKMQFNSL